MDFERIDSYSALYLFAFRLISIAMTLGVMLARRPALPHLCPVLPHWAFSNNLIGYFRSPLFFPIFNPSILFSEAKCS